MNYIDYLVPRCRHLFRTSLKRSLVTIALVLAFTIFMLVPRSTEQAVVVHASRYFLLAPGLIFLETFNHHMIQQISVRSLTRSSPCSRKNAFFLGSGAAGDGNGLGQLVLETPHESTSITYDPYPEYNSVEWKSMWRGTYQQCVGANGSVLDRRNAETAMKGFRWNHLGLKLRQAYAGVR